MTETTIASDLATTYDAARAYELDRAHVFHSWSAQANLKPMVIAGGAGLMAALYARARHAAGPSPAAGPAPRMEAR